MRDLITEPISDAGLLERFASHRDEAAFGELVKRHGPQVLKVCRRGLPSEHDVEDVFQATFFVLAHKAAAVSWNESVESWLCAVARRLVLHARASAWQRQSRERPITALGGARAEEYSGFLPDQDHPLYDPREEMERRDIHRVLHAALGQLPEKYRIRSYSATSRARPTRRPRDSLDGRRVQCRGACTHASLLRRRLARCGLLIALCAVCAAFAFARVGQLGPRSQPATVSVRQAMQSLRFPSGAAMNLESRLQRSLGDGQVSREREQLEALARKAQWVAEQTADQDPGRSSELWLFHAAKMHWRHLILARRPGSAIGQPCWVRLDNWTPPASAATKSSATRSTACAVRCRDRQERPGGDWLASGVGKIPQAATVSRCLGDHSGQRVWFPAAVTDRITLLPR